MENNDTKLEFLIKEDKDYVKTIRLGDGELIKGGLILRIYKQRSGKITATISKKSVTPNFLEDIFFYENDLDSESLVYTTLDVMRAINLP